MRIMKRAMKKLLLFAAVCIFLLVCACDSERPQNQQPKETAVVSKKISAPKQETDGKQAQKTAEKSDSPPETSAEDKEKTAAGKTGSGTSERQKTVSPSSEKEKPEAESSGVKTAQKTNTASAPTNKDKKETATGSGTKKETSQTGHTSESNRTPEDRNKQAAAEVKDQHKAAAEAQDSKAPEKGETAGEKAAPGKEGSEKSIEDILTDTDAAYTSAGKIDPFEPLIETEKEEKEAEGKAPEEKKPKRKLTPLEKLDLSQLKLVAVVDVKGRNNFAMVQEASGKGYIVKVGTYIGKNSGRITEITDDRIIIREQIKNFKGEYETDYKEMKLQKKNNL